MLLQSEAYLEGEAIVPWPPPLPKFFFDILKKLENLGLPPICVSTSGQRKFAPPLEILNTPLPTGYIVAQVCRLMLLQCLTASQINVVTMSYSSENVVTMLHLQSQCCYNVAQFFQSMLLQCLTALQTAYQCYYYVVQLWKSMFQLCSVIIPNRRI